MSVSEAQIAEMRTAYDLTLRDLATVKKPSNTETRDAYGELTTADETVVSGVKCGYRILNGMERIVAGGQAAAGDVEIRFESSVAGVVKPEMTVVIEARDPLPERTFKVTRALETSLTVGARVIAVEA